MFDIGFGELLLVFVIGLIVLGPQRLPVAVKTVAGWIRALRSLAATVQNELSQELKLQEFQDSLKKVEKASLDNLSPEFKQSMDELRQAAESMKRSYSVNDPEKASDEANTIHIQPTDATPAEPIAQASAPATTVHGATPPVDVAGQSKPVSPVTPAADAAGPVPEAVTPLSSDRPVAADNATGKKS